MLRAGARIPPGIVGSSPLTRGKRVRSLDNLGQVGLIPAHAGKTRPVAGASGWVEAHPRSRGENLAILAAHADGGGSSPLTRGKHVSQGRLNEYDRLIPAHAGKTLSDRHLRTNHPAHPRSRGENDDEQRGYMVDAGSSPLTRGKHRAHLGRHLRSGLIPAHAGKTTSLTRDIAGTEAHPRSRGENNRFSNAVYSQKGSSPLTRGKQPLQQRRLQPKGLIPAHAGKTRGYSPAASARGSSPLTRGKLWASTRGGRACRLIPAHAGKTFAASQPISKGTAHPRSRGENYPACSI